jgi:glycosyltransferase involved in cell wall biosynthesis
VVAAPHQEGSMLEIARAAARHAQLTRMYTTLHTATFQAAAARIPQRALREALDAQLARRSFSGVPLGVIQPVAQLSQAMHVLSMRLPRAQTLASWLLYDSKKRFDRAVSRRIAGQSFDALIALNFSAAATFQRMRETGGVRVLDFIDSHPRYQNRYLRELCGLEDPHWELVFPDVIGRVENELEFADLILTPSRFVADQREAVGIARDKLAVEPFGVDVLAFRPDSSRPKHLRSRVPRGLFVGQISYRKGLGVLLEAARRLRNRRVEFQLVGPLISPEVLRGMPDQVNYRGARLSEGVAQAMRDADFFLLPSIEDAFGLVTLEAMASGLPPIVSDHVGASELISSGKDGLVTRAGDASALAEAIGALLDDGELRGEMGLAARARVERGCSWEEYGDRVIALVDERVRSDAEAR